MVGTQQKQKILRRGGKNTQKNCTKKIFATQSRWCDHSPRARHPGLLSQVDLLGSIITKLVEVIESQLSYSKS